MTGQAVERDWRVGDCAYWLSWAWVDPARAILAGTVTRVTPLYVWVLGPLLSQPVRRDRDAVLHTLDEAWAMLLQDRARALDRARREVRQAEERLAEGVEAWLVESGAVPS